MLMFDRMSEETTTSNQDEIVKYESLLKTIPQFQMISDDDVSNRLNCMFSFLPTV